MDEAALAKPEATAHGGREKLDITERVGQVLNERAVSFER